eukprot:CAMPEP_0181284394 /NCGR_PEP_ID=MMETSP1097-20121128/15373_1 /TAXON_ID=35684 /ORGANISM="Pseudopedinella elastica, Strain CCMP716" /LENGTH=56 /DNA_ID=CAMNT_0023387811 /DNA_START=53 /DNA_END=220 /DNA_ORIENTATION=+
MPKTQARGPGRRLRPVTQAKDSGQGLRPKIQAAMRTLIGAPDSALSDSALSSPARD